MSKVFAQIKANLIFELRIPKKNSFDKFKFRNYIKIKMNHDNSLNI